MTCEPATLKGRPYSVLQQYAHLGLPVLGFAVLAGAIGGILLWMSYARDPEQETRIWDRSAYTFLIIAVVMLVVGFLLVVTADSGDENWLKSL